MSYKWVFFVIVSIWKKIGRNNDDIDWSADDSSESGGGGYLIK